MLTNYTFLVDGVERFPHWTKALAKEFEFESEQRFFRAKLKGKLVFVGEDYDYLANASFDTKFNLVIEYQGAPYFSGEFTKVDITWDADNKKASAEITTRDRYTEILKGLENEYDLIKLAPAKTRVSLWRRPLFQAYVPGDNVVANFLGGAYWEQPVILPESDAGVIENNYKFKRGTSFFKVVIDDINTNRPGVVDDYVQERAFNGSVYTEALLAWNENFKHRFIEQPSTVKATSTSKILNVYGSAGTVSITYPANGGDVVNIAIDGTENRNQVASKIAAGINADNAIGLTCRANLADLNFTAKIGGTVENGKDLEIDHGFTGIVFDPVQPTMSGGLNAGYKYVIIESSSGNTLYESAGFGVPQTEGAFTLNAVSGGATGSVEANLFGFSVYTRVITDADFYKIVVTEDIPANDIVEPFTNYSKLASIGVDAFTIINTSKIEPTQYGLRPDNKYYIEPVEANKNYFPAGRSQWGKASIWFNANQDDFFKNEIGTKHTLKDAYKVSDAIEALLAEIAPSISYGAQTGFSQFLNSGTNPISGDAFTLLMAQKTNILVGDYDQPATRAPIKLSDILSMLRDCYQLYWFIDDDNHFIIEHIKYFKNGGSYSAAPNVGLDLRTARDMRTGKPWAFQTSSWKFDKQDIPERLEFAWMDQKVTAGFLGLPIETVSPYTEAGKIEKTVVGQFTTDLDYMLAAPSDFNRDGFALLATEKVGSTYEVLFLETELAGVPLYMQNGLLSLAHLLPTYHTWDLPTRKVRINEDAVVAQGIRRAKKQKVSFPSIEDVVLFDLIKTYIGDGEIEKLSVNLASRFCTVDLRYDTDA